MQVVLDEEDYLLPSFAHLLPQPDGKSLFQIGAKDYLGEGIAVKHLTVEGPMRDSASVLITELAGNDRGTGMLDRTEILDLLKPFVIEALRRLVQSNDLQWLDRFVAEKLETGMSSREIMLSAMRHVLTSPQFLYLAYDPGPLDDFDLASRLSYFLWKRSPDHELKQEAEAGQLDFCCSRKHWHGLSVIGIFVVKKSLSSWGS